MTQLVRLLVASLLAFLATSSAHALSCQKIAEEQSLALLDEAVLIFDGEIVSVSSQPGAPDGSPMAEARVIEPYKGETPSDFVSFQVPGWPRHMVVTRCVKRRPLTNSRAPHCRSGTLP